MYTMAGTAKDVVVKDSKGSRVDVGKGLLGNTNLLLILIAIVLICCLCGGDNDFFDPLVSGSSKRRRRRNGNGLLLLLLPLILLRGIGGGNQVPNTNTNIINVDTLGAEEGGLLDL